MSRSGTVTLAGGCLVMPLRSGEHSRTGTLDMWRLVGRDVGARAISLRVLEFARGLSPGWTNATCEEVFYVLEGSGTVFHGGRPFEVSPDSGIYLEPGVSFAVDNPGPGSLVLISSLCPEPDDPASPGVAITCPAVGPASSRTPPIVRLADREACPTGDRWYRVLVDHEIGCRLVTQFVGSIPPGRAPDHLHHYEEVLCILQGTGLMWAGGASALIGPGSCVFLPRGQFHCVENTGREELRLLGVLHPAGSPAVRYAPGSKEA